MKRASIRHINSRTAKKDTSHPIKRVRTNVSNEAHFVQVIIKFVLKSAPLFRFEEGIVRVALSEEKFRREDFI